MSQGWPGTGEKTRREGDLPPEVSLGPPLLDRERGHLDSISTQVNSPSEGFRDSRSEPFRTDVATPQPGSSGEPIERGPVQIAPGQLIFGKYEVIERLGRGGMGEVWLVRDVDLDVKRAIKMITQGTAFNPEARARFSREARAMARFSHPNVVAVHDSRLDHHDVAYIVMEYVNGESLEKILRPGHPMPLDWTLRVLSQLCDALQDAHGQGIIHRDLKPSNLILVNTPSKQDLLKVLDFGIAKILNVEEVTQDARTMEGAFIGTPPYASPEQASGHAVPLSDIYSVGVILYEFLTGSRPFSGRPAYLIASTMFTEPPPFSEVNGEATVPPELERVVMRCLAKKPEDRPQSAFELLQDFRSAMPTLEYVPTKRSDEPPSTRLGTPRSSRRVGLLGVAAVALVAAVAGFAVLARRPVPPPPELEAANEGGGKTSVDPVNPTPEPAIVHRGRSFQLWDGRFYLPTGYKPADGTNPARDGWPSEIVREADQVPFLRIPGGKFRMGARYPVEADRTDAEVVDLPGDDKPRRVVNLPAREVEVEGFYLQKHEVTNAEILAHATQDGDPFTDPAAVDTWRTWYEQAKAIDPETALKQPARMIRWPLADAFARRHGGRIPSEAQWEFAARSRQTDRVLVWDDEKDRANPAEELGNLFNRDLKVAAVGSYPFDKTQQGIMDMAGNVREWTRDPWVDYDKLQPGVPPEAQAKPSPDTTMVVRGGSFLIGPDAKFVTHRGKPFRISEQVPFDLGFRMVIECPERSAGTLAGKSSP